LYTQYVTAFNSFNYFKAEIESGRKDVREQREQLYRKLDVLKAQGIELGPNMAILKSDPLPPKASASNADVYFYSEVSPNSESANSGNNSNRFVSILRNILFSEQN
jgi:hypothetical protein